MPLLPSVLLHLHRRPAAGRLLVLVALLASVFNWPMPSAYAAGVRRVADLAPGSASASPHDLVAVNNQLFFVANDGTHGDELWTSDGTTTRMVVDLNPGPAGSAFWDFVAAADRVFFVLTRRDGNSAVDDLWTSDGTATGTVRLLSWYADHYTPSLNMTTVHNTVFFRAVSAVGSELWKSDGTIAGTVLVKDIYPDGDAVPADLTNVNGTVFFMADDGMHGRELWKSDGTDAGTVLVKDIVPGPGSTANVYTHENYHFTFSSNLTSVNSTLFFTGGSGGLIYSLFASDGTDAGTMLVKNAGVGCFTNVNGILFFCTSDGMGSDELWKSDGTTSGTVLVKAIGQGTSDAYLRSLTNVNGVLCFVTSNALWKSDGTTAGTVWVQDLDDLGRYAGGNTNPYMTVVNGRLYFRGVDARNGIELWTSDGTTAGTMRVTDLNPGSNHSDPTQLTNVQGRLFFTANDGTSGTELWTYGPLPIVTLSGNGQPIPDGTSIPRSTNATDLGRIPLGQAVTHTFTLTNTGDAALTLTGTPTVVVNGTAASDFQVTPSPISFLAPGTSTTFQITFTPRAEGLRQATVILASNTSATMPFTFVIAGTGALHQIYLPLATRY